MAGQGRLNAEGHVFARRLEPGTEQTHRASALANLGGQRVSTLWAESLSGHG
jgi:hypothetical protein